jgi:hypothetical protein
MTSRGRHVESTINATPPKSINVALDALLELVVWQRR